MLIDILVAVQPNWLRTRSPRLSRLGKRAAFHPPGCNQRPFEPCGFGNVFGTEYGRSSRGRAEGPPEIGST